MGDRRGTCAQGDVQAESDLEKIRQEQVIGVVIAIDF